MICQKICVVFCWFVFFQRFDSLWECFCWFSRMFFFDFLKTFGKTKQTKNKPISKGESETFKNFVCLVFPKVFVGCLWLSLVCVVFPKVFGVF